MKRVLTAIVGAAFTFAQGHAQDIDRQQNKSAFDEFRKAVRSDFDSFRHQCMQEYTDFVRNPWKEFGSSKPVPRPVEKDLPPVVVTEEEPTAPRKDVPITIEEVIPVMPVTPQPQPLEPVREMPVERAETVSFAFFGTTASVRFDTDDVVRLSTLNESAVADALGRFKAEAYDNLLYDCLRLRKEYGLCDWAYLLMLKSLSEEIGGKETNDAELLMAYLFMQSGYKVRLAFSGSRLYMLYASRHAIYESVSYRIDGDNYYGVRKLPSSLHVCQAGFPKEQRLSLLVNTPQHFAEAMSQQRTITSQKFPDMKVSVSVNRNLLDFYATYPSSMLDNNQMTRWAMYANTPMDNGVQQQLYPAMRALLKDLPKPEAVNRLLNWVQTGFSYEYDDKVWGHDRAFFAEESLYYPYCDCEDRSILLTRLVRDLLGLKCVLVYYPGHLASAIAFDEHVAGDYIELDGHRYVIADGTFIGASLGSTMTGMDNRKAKVILLY